MSQEQARVRIRFKGKLVDEPEVKAGFIGCGSHSFRNLCPTFQFAPVNLVATCDLDGPKAEAFAAKSASESAYSNHQQMLTGEDLDAVVIDSQVNCRIKMGLIVCSRSEGCVVRMHPTSKGPDKQ